MCSISNWEKEIEYHKGKDKNGASAPSPDRSGRHASRPHKMDSEVRDRIKHHIASFPADQSHYSRNNNAHKLYLSPLLNVTKMYNINIEMCCAGNLLDKFKIKNL
ncbi:unnamed protein product [Pieris macdunnoughi]|uniref:Uncharacterized protein n=1 Tax=Pieris macdunnoughi TaxID=345717 RepID=A0A821XLX1_9NEOP|nr:unnamed protein product [Pieris macdunnoughi]